MWFFTFLNFFGIFLQFSIMRQVGTEWNDNFSFPPFSSAFNLWWPMPPMPLYTMTSPWPFSIWGIDIIGKIHSTTSNSHEFILLAIDYFIKWVEATSYKVLNSKKVTQFIQTNIICRYGVPHEIILDNGLHFKGEIEKLLQ